MIQSRAGAPPDPQTVRLLIAEDDERLADVIARGLRKHSYAVDVVNDGARAVTEAAVVSYDAIILDIMLPKVDGLTVARTLRVRGSRVPILMLTARDAISDRVAGLDAGADDYLIKPFAFDELLARVRALLRRGGQLAPTVLEAGDLRVDTVRMTVACGERQLELTSKEYGVLEYFARHYGFVLSREQITTHVWDSNHDPFSNALEVLVSRVRRKLEVERSITRIHTRRGLGYVMLSRAHDAPSADT